MPGNAPIPAWNAPANYSVQRHQQMVDALNSISALRGTGKVQTRVTSTGTTIDPVPDFIIRPAARVKLTSVITSQGGQYNGKTYNGPLVSITSGNIAESNLGVINTAENVIVWNLAEIGLSTHFLQFSAAGQQDYPVLVFGNDGATNKPIAFINVMPNLVFPVTLSQTGGSNGNATTQASWTYTVSNLAGDSLGTSVSPVWAARGSIGLMTAATAGLAYYDGSGTLVLAVAYETPGGEECDS